MVILFYFIAATLGKTLWIHEFEKVISWCLFGVFTLELIISVLEL